MSMLVRILDQIDEDAINAACAELVEKGRFVVSVDVFDEAIPYEAHDGFSPPKHARHTRCMIKHMADDQADYQKKAIDAENALQRIVDGIKPETQPEQESYDDTESAYGNGMAVANWETATDLEGVIARLRA